jgi:small subunit ribosomal protein S16
MLMLRLQRIGRRNEAHFKIVVIENTKGPKSQKYVDIVGSYNPKLGRVEIDTEKAKQWLANGVQPSDTVYNMLVTKGLVEGRKKNVLPKKSPVIDHEAIARAQKEAEEKAAKELAAKKAAEEEAARAAEAAAQAEETPAEADPEEKSETAQEEPTSEEAPQEETEA